MTERASFELVAQAKRYAALSAIYDPLDALPQSVLGDPLEASLIASELALASDTNPDEGNGWLLRTSERKSVLEMLQSHGLLADAVADRMRLPVDPVTQDLLHAVTGQGLFEPGQLAATIVDIDTTMPALERIVAALNRSEAVAPGAASLRLARLRLAELTEVERRAGIAKRGFFGRDVELATIGEWLAAPIKTPRSRAAVISGNPGIGKSALLDVASAMAVERNGAVVVRLDFDRAGLDVLDLRGMTMELARQLSERIGVEAESLIDARLAAARVERGSISSDRSTRGAIPIALAGAIGAAVKASDRPVHLALDTLENLRSRGDRHVGQLFNWIDDLVGAGMTPLTIVAAGRGDVLDLCADRAGPVLPLAGLDRASALALLDRLEVAPRSRELVLNIANGSPLVMRLAARVVRDYGARSLPRTTLTGEVAAGFLYRFLLSRIVDPDLRRLAHPGLIARRISADFVREVLGPQLGMKSLSVDRAQALFDALASEHWLVERDPIDPAFVRHRGDMRALLLPLLYRSRPGQCARVDASAANWFQHRGDDASLADATYHRLQLMRSRPRPPLVDPAIAWRLDPAAIEELPPTARLVVERAQGGRSSLYRGESGDRPTPGDEETIEVLQHLVDSGDWLEGRHVIEQIEERGFDPRGVVADAICAFHWRAGHWAQAHHLFVARDQLARDDSDFLDHPTQLALAWAEMRAEFGRRARDLELDERSSALIDSVGKGSALARFGALGFTHARLQGRENQDWDNDGDPVAAALAIGTNRQSSAAEFTFGVARDRLRSRGFAARDIGWNDAQMLATLTPYVTFAASLAVQQRPPQALLRDAGAAQEKLAQAGALIGDAPLGASSSNPIAGVAELGLFAEWAGVAAFFSSDADLRWIARSAERWRRTVAGDWVYGRAPRGWQPPGPLDRTLARRLSILLDRKDVESAALEQLSLWISGDDSLWFWSHLRRRFAVAFKQASLIKDPFQRAARLRRALPAAFVPAAAILTTR